MNLKIAALLFAVLPSSWGETPPPLTEEDGHPGIRGLATNGHHSPPREGEPCHHGNCHKGLTCVKEICADASLENEDKEVMQADDEDKIAKAFSRFLPISQAHAYRSDIEMCLFTPTCRGSICDYLDGNVCVDDGSSCVQLETDPWFSCSCPEGMVNARDPTRCEPPKPDGKTTLLPPQPSALIGYIKEHQCPSDVDSCPIDAVCLLSEESGEPECYCKLSGKHAVEGATCYEMDHYERVDPASGDDACDAKEAGCGKGARCAIENDEPICHCEGRGSVPKGTACKSFEEKQVNENLRQKGNVGPEGGRRDLNHADMANIAIQGCMDYENWEDSFGDDCSYYERYDNPGCPRYGNYFEAFDSAGVGLGKPKFACCYCNGGCDQNPTQVAWFTWYVEPITECNFKVDDPEKFTIVFVSDMENQYRNHHDEWCGEIAEHIRTIGSLGYRYANGDPIENPSLVIHGGDISDSNSGWRSGITRNDNAIWDTTYQRFYDADIPIISILGNHDEVGNHDEDESPESARSEATQFVRRTFTTSAATSSDFTYEEVQVHGAHHPYYAVNFRGVQIATINNAYEGINNSFRQAFNTEKPIMSFSHQPLSRSSHANIQEYKDFLGTFPRPFHFSGHTHRYTSNYYNGINEYVAPYPHPNANDYDLTPGYLALEVSPIHGVIGVSRIGYDYQSVTGCWGSGQLCISHLDCNRCCPSIGDTCDMSGCACGDRSPGDMAATTLSSVGSDVVDFLTGWW